MSQSLKFKHVSNNTLKLFDIISQSQEIKRLLKYKTDDPYALETYDRDGIWVSQPDIDDSLFESHIILTPYSPTILNSGIATFMLINPMNGKLSEDPISNEIYTIDIICNISYWILNGLSQFRCFEIAGYIADLIDQKDVMGLGMVKINEYAIGKVNDEFAVLSIPIRVQNGTIEY